MKELMRFRIYFSSDNFSPMIDVLCDRISAINIYNIFSHQEYKYTYDFSDLNGTYFDLITTKVTQFRNTLVE